MKEEEGKWGWVPLPFLNGVLNGNTICIGKIFIFEYHGS